MARSVVSTDLAPRQHAFRASGEEARCGGSVEIERGMCHATNAIVVCSDGPEWPATAGSSTHAIAGRTFEFQ